MAATNKALGPRVSVLVAQKKGVKGAKGGKKLYSFMAKKTAELFGFAIDNRAASGAAAKGKVQRIVRGSSGAGSIKVPISSGGSGNDAKKKFVSIPIPSGVTLADIKTFLGKASKNKPDSFVSKQGRTYPLSDAKGKK